MKNTTPASKPRFRPDDSRRDARALLGALAGDAAYGVNGEAKGQPRIIVAAARRGVSICVGAFSPDASESLCSDGLARWEQATPSGRARLLITDEGRARLARQSPPEGSDPFLAQHVPLKSREVDRGAPVLVDEAESPLAWLATRKGPDGKPLIDVASLQAGERLRRDLTFAQMLPRVTANWTAVTSAANVGQAGTYSDLAIAARQRVARALDFVGGDFAGLLMDVCGFLKGLETIETERGWPRRSAKLVLSLSLRQLARHYGIGAAASGPARSPGLVHWGAKDYRPSMSPAAPDD